MVKAEECSRGAGLVVDSVPPEGNWLERSFEFIITGLFSVIIPLALITFFVVMILGWIVEDIWRWLRGKNVRPVLMEGGYAETGLQSRDLESRGFDPRAGHNQFLQQPVSPQLGRNRTVREGALDECVRVGSKPASLDYRIGMRAREKVFIYGGLVGLVLLFFFTFHVQKGIMQEAAPAPTTQR